MATEPERMPIMKAVEARWRESIAIPHERILDCCYEPYEHRGDLELIIAESKR